MATTTNFSWATPDDSANVKDGASAIRSLGTAIDTSLVDLKGGTTGQTLTKATNTDMDFSWATPAAGGGMTSLLTGSFSSTTTSIASIPSGYKELIVVVRNMSFAASNTQMRLRVNNNTSAIYGTSAHNTSTTAVQNTSVTATSIDLTQGSTLQINQPNLMKIIIPDYAESNQKYFHFFGVMYRPGPSPAAFNGVGHINTTAAISSIQFIVDAGNYNGGTYIVYGVN